MWTANKYGIRFKSRYSFERPGGTNLQTFYFICKEIPTINHYKNRKKLIRNRLFCVRLISVII